MNATTRGQVAVLLTVLASSTWADAGTQPDTSAQAAEKALAVLMAARQNAKDIRNLQVTQEAAETATCKEALDQDEALRDSTVTNAKSVGLAAQAAWDAHKSCQAAGDLVRMNKQLHQAALTLLRLVATDLDDCNGKAPQCQAETLAGTVQALAGELAYGSKPIHLATRVAALQLAASKAQKAVSDRRSEIAGVYPIGDKAARQAIEYSQTDKPDLGRLDELVTAGWAAKRSAADARRALGTAQLGANVLVDQGLVLAQPCKATDAPCQQRSEAARKAAVAALAVTDAHQALAGKAHADAREAGWKADATATFASARDREAAVQFARLLDANPDARSLVGSGDAYKLTASTANSSAAFRLGLSRLLPAGWHETSLIVSAPAGKGVNTSLYTSADGLAKATTVQLNKTIGKGLDTHSRVPGLDALWLAGGALTFGSESRNYYDPADLSKTLSQTERKWSASLYAALYRTTAADPFVHLLKLDLQRGSVDAEPESRCSVPKSATDTSVTCVTGSFGPPKREYARVYTYQFRRQTATWAVAPSIAFNDVTRVTEFNLPWYRVASGDSDKNQLNAGVNLGWSSKSRGSIGVFVGAPFSLYGGD